MNRDLIVGVVGAAILVAAMAGVFYYEKNNVAAPPVLTSTTNSTGPQAGGQTAAGASTDQVVAINASNLVNVTFTLKWTAAQGKDTMKLAVAPSNGTLVTQLHTPLIAHTGGDIVTLETGLYPDRHGLAVSNTYRYFTPAGPARTAVAFTYWTAPVFDPGAAAPSDTSYNLVGADGQNVPAPWVPFTRAGCDVGAAGIANAVLENTATDVATVFGTGSAEAQAVATNADQAFADYVGIAVHCAQGSSMCASGHADRLPQEAGGYAGFQALFGHKEVAPAG